jgi:formate hydrogenlyase subunit 3/multisubunit Na+/H+ antiporter MnhD subunit
MIGLHVWLPLAHPVAPTPASAVLSGSMIAAGLLGWLRILPLGEMTLPSWGGIMISAGLVAVFYAAIIGLMQSNPKTILAYSSISAMGIITMGVGLGLIAPENWSAILNAVLIFTLHHALAKGALFLGVGVFATSYSGKLQHRLLLIGMILPALSLAAAPLSSGMIAKNMMKLQAVSTTSFWSEWILTLLPWSSVATSMLMLHFLSLLWQGKNTLQQQQTPITMRLSWVFLVLLVVINQTYGAGSMASCSR